MKRLASCLVSLAFATLAPAALADEAPAAPAAPMAPAAEAAGPLVELSADDDRATIERRAATTGPSGLGLVETGLLSVGHWQHACVAPCELRLDPRYSYRVAGDGLVPSDSFAIPRGQDHVRVDAKMGSSIGRVAGGLATAGGVAAVALGGLALVATPVLENEDVGSQGFRNAVFVGGLGALTVGAVAAGIGLFMWFSNASSASPRGEVARQASADPRSGRPQTSAAR
jgi:hypothetical protein